MRSCCALKVAVILLRTTSAELYKLWFLPFQTVTSLVSLLTTKMTRSFNSYVALMIPVLLGIASLATEVLNRAVLPTAGATGNTVRLPSTRQSKYMLLIHIITVFTLRQHLRSSLLCAYRYRSFLRIKTCPLYTFPVRLVNIDSVQAAAPPFWSFQGPCLKRGGHNNHLPCRSSAS